MRLIHLVVVSTFQAEAAALVLHFLPEDITVHNENLDGRFSSSADSAQSCISHQYTHVVKHSGGANCLSLTASQPEDLSGSKCLARKAKGEPLSGDCVLAMQWNRKVNAEQILWLAWRGSVQIQMPCREGQSRAAVGRCFCFAHPGDKRRQWLVSLTATLPQVLPFLCSVSMHSIFLPQKTFCKGVCRRLLFVP